MQTTWLAEVESSRFSEFLQVFWGDMREVAGDIPESPPEGVGEVPAEPWPLSYALDTNTRFAAFRWYQPNPNSPTGKPLRYEAFFLSPANTGPRIGLRILSADDSEIRIPSAWWNEKLSLQTTPHTGSSVPGFMELAAILAANGNIVTSSADMQAVVAELTFELDYYRQLNEDQAEELRQLRAKLRDALSRPAPQVIDLVDDAEEAGPTEPATDLSGLPEWAAQNQERITLLPRALNGAKKSIYENPSAVYTALEVLAGPYREHRLGNITRDEFNDTAAKAGLQLARSVGPSVAGSHGDTYFVTWNGRRRFLDSHLLKGGGRDERYCLRVYFFWDEDTNQAIVGWLPNHLNNSLS